MNSPTPRYSIIVPVLNETTSINGILAHLRGLEGQEGAEIIVVDGDPEGATLTAIRCDGVQKILSPPGRAVQMNGGAKNARGDILIFLHADTSLPPDALQLIDKMMQNRMVMGGAFDLGFQSVRFAFKMIAAVASARSRFTRVPFGDQAPFFRRKYFERIGGYKEIPIMEDVELMERIRRRGDLIAFIDKQVLTSTRRWDKEGIFHCTLRNWRLQWFYLLGVPPERLARYYRVNQEPPSHPQGTAAERKPSRPSHRGPVRLLSLLFCLALTLPLTSVPGRGENRVLFREDFHSLENWRPLHFPKISAHTLYWCGSPSDGQPCRHERLGQHGAGLRVLYRLPRGLP